MSKSLVVLAPADSLACCPPLSAQPLSQEQAEQTRLAEAGLASVDERDTTCCYARQDKFWVQGAPNGERWEIYTVLEDSATFWGQDSGRSWAAAEAALESSQAGPAQTAPCCGGQQDSHQAIGN